MNLIFGVAGFAKEVDWLTYEVFKISGVDYRTNFFIAEDGNESIGSHVNSCLVRSESDVFAAFCNEEVNCFIAVGSPGLKKKIVSIITKNLPHARFPNLVHPDVSYDDRPGKVMMGRGNIICSKSVITTDVALGDFVHINLDCTVGHDSVIGDYVTISPGVHVSGNVTIGEQVFIGSGAVITERITLGPNTLLGANSTLNKNIDEPGVYVGSPARKVK